MNFVIKKVRIDYKDKKTGKDLYFYKFYLVSTIDSSLVIAIKDDNYNDSKELNRALLVKFSTTEETKKIKEGN